MLRAASAGTALAVAAIVAPIAAAQAPLPHGDPAPAEPRTRVDSPPLSGAAPGEIVPGEVVVRFKRPVAGRGLLAEAREALGAAPGSAEGLIIPRAKVIQLPGGLDVRAAARRLERLPGVAYAEPNFRRELLATSPDDQFFPQMWGLHNTGQTIGGQPGLPDADIDAPEAWDYGRGSNDVIVGVIDSGIDLDHRDLAPNLWTNPRETPGNGVDEDGNGLVDDVHGWDFTEDDNVPNDDTSGHGTHVSGTIGARGNNRFDTTGVNWNVRLMPLRIGFDLSRSVDSAAGAEAMFYAGEQGASVVNGSYGGFGSSTQLERDAVRSAPHTLFVFAAGNAGSDNDAQPSSPADLARTEPNVLSVAAIDNRGKLAGFSNYGATSVDLAAPGVNIESTYLDPADVVASSAPYVTEPGTVDAYGPLHFGGFLPGSDDPAGWMQFAAQGDALSWVTTDQESSDPQTFDFYSLTDSHASNYPSSSTTWVESPQVSLAGRKNCVYRFWADLDLADAGDKVVFSASRNGGAAYPFEVSATGPFNDSGTFSFQLGSEFDGAANVKLRVLISSNGSGVADGIHFDSPTIVCGAGEAASGHGQISGTSMASPHVAGAGALLASHAPAASGADIEDRMLATVAPNPNLQSFVATDGQLNLERLTRPPATRITAGPPARTHATTARFDFALDQLNASLGAAVECALDGGPYRPCDSASSHSRSGLAAGRHTFSVRGSWKGYRGAPASRTFTVEDPDDPDDPNDPDDPDNTDDRDDPKGSDAACAKAKKKLKRARKQLKRAKRKFRKVRDEGSRKQVKQAKRKLKKAKRKVKRAKRVKKRAC